MTRSFEVLYVIRYYFVTDLQFFTLSSFHFFATTVGNEIVIHKQFEGPDRSNLWMSVVVSDLAWLIREVFFSDLSTN